MPPDLSIVIPLYNEEENLPQVPNALVAAMEAAAVDYEMVLVDNGSKDATGQVLDRMAEANPRIRVVRVMPNEGYGWGVINGLRAASGRCVGFMAGDGQIEPADVVRTYRLLQEDSLDLAKVRRVRRHDGIKRIFISTMCNLLFPLFFPVGTRDINGTPKIMRRELAERLRITSKDWFIDAEIMIKLGRMGARIGEVPIDFLAREKGSSSVRWWTVVEFLMNMWRFRNAKVEGREGELCR